MGAGSQLEPGGLIDDRYRIRRRLGAGGFGEVWLAIDERAGGIGREVALKLLHPRVFEMGDVVRERFDQEAEILARLDHPSIVRPLAFSRTDSSAYLAMEFVEGVPLDRVLRKCAKDGEHLDPSEIVRVFDELAAAVHYIHGEGVVHRDLKPSNVMFVRRGGRAFVKLLDLGVARILTPNERDATTLGRVVGSLHYASPEQVRGERADAKSDVFALGVILFELVTSRRAFLVDADRLPANAYKPPLKLEANALPRVGGRILGGARPKVSDVREGVPLALDEVVARALAIDPGERFASAAALAEAAVPLLRELGRDRGTTIYSMLSDVDILVEGDASDAARTVTSPDASGFDAKDTAPPRGEVFEATDAAMASVARPLGARSSSRMWGAAAIVVLALGVGTWAFVMRVERAPIEHVPERVVTEPRAAVRAVAVESGDDDARTEGAEPNGDGPSEGGLGANAKEAVPEPRDASERGTKSERRGADPNVEARARRRDREPPSSSRDEGAVRVAPVSASSAATRTRLEQLVADARANPGDLARVAALGDAVRRAVATLPPGGPRTRLERRIETAEMDGDVEALAACVRAWGDETR